MATPTGLITPIVQNVDKKGLVDITTDVKDLAGRAKTGKLAPEEYQGGTFTISNLGMFGINQFSAVINQPQGCIMAVGGGTRTVVVDSKESGQFEPAAPPRPPTPSMQPTSPPLPTETQRNSPPLLVRYRSLSTHCLCTTLPRTPEPRVATIMTARVSCDRRVVDEAIAAQYLQAFQFYMNTPALLMM